MAILNPASLRASRLAALRAALAAAGVAGCIVPRADEHLGEYVPPPPSASPGSPASPAAPASPSSCPTAPPSSPMAAIRCRPPAETDPALWERHHIQEDPPESWLARTAPGARIGYDPMLISEAALRRFEKAGLAMVPLAPNPLDALWNDRPPPPLAPCAPHPLAFAGEDSLSKRTRLAAALAAAGEDAAILSDPASVNWLLNIRGRDLEFTPVALGFALLFANASVQLFMAPEKLSPETRAWLGPDVTLAPPAALASSLARLAGRRVRVDPSETPAWFAATLRAAGATISDCPDPSLLAKACKNATEQEGARIAHRRDAVAVARFLAWLSRAAGRETECSAAAQLLAFRQALPGFAGESFPAISGAGEHGAIIHYRAGPATDRPIRPNEAYLINSGAQFPEGTTDITRTVWTGPDDPPPELAERATRVLAGNIALATLRFPEGVAGSHIDAIARRALWDAGLDFDHGTGHGVGSFLSVHEGPARISRQAPPIALQPGMILSDEPGFYLPGAYGIRLENLLLVQPSPSNGKPFLAFETLTLAPFARRLIQPALLNPAARAWLDAYHARVFDTVAPSLPPEDRAWLQSETLPLG